MVAGKDAEERVADLVHGRGAALPNSVDLGVEAFAANVVEGQLALELDALRQPGRVDGFDLALEFLGVGDLLDDRVARGVVELAVVVVDPEVRGEDRVILDQTPEVGLDDVPERLVERALGRLGRGPRENEFSHRYRSRIVVAGAAVAAVVVFEAAPAVSCRAARQASSTRSTSDAETP